MGGGLGICRSGITRPAAGRAKTRGAKMEVMNVSVSVVNFILNSILDDGYLVGG